MLGNSGKISFLEELRRKLVERDIWEPSVHPSGIGCKYRSNGNVDDLACFIGLFIPDSRYERCIDGFEPSHKTISLGTLVEDRYIKFPGLTREDQMFLGIVQKIHDMTPTNIPPGDVRALWLSRIADMIRDLREVRANLGD